MRLSNGITKNNVFSTLLKYIRVLTQTFSNWCDVHSFRIAFVIFVEPRTSFLSSILNPRKFTLSHPIYLLCIILYLFLKVIHKPRGLVRWLGKMGSQNDHAIFVDNVQVENIPYLRNEISSLLKNFSYKTSKGFEQ